MKNKKSSFLSPAPPDFKWPQCPEADAFIRRRLVEFLQGHAFARRLAERMRDETSTEFQVWVDHLILPKPSIDVATLVKTGFEKDRNNKDTFWHPFADLPRLRLTSKRAVSCAIMVESISDFLLAQQLSLPILGNPYSLYREARLPDGPSDLLILERRGSKTFTPDTKNRPAFYLAAYEMWLNRRRHFKNPVDGMGHAQKLAETMVKKIGAGMAAWAFLEAERRYWQTRNRAAQIQKSRQDQLGLGWANHDHHTFRSSRSGFPGLIKILQTFGFKKRERFYAGAEAGWGAQVLEQPEARLIIFADVDLTPQETNVDFAARSLPDLKKPGTVGLWCALHGDSILEAGMHHLEAKFDFDHLQRSLKTDSIHFMNPFSDFPHLRQAFSVGEPWFVPPERLARLKLEGKLSEEAAIQIKQKGAVGSHLENLQRRDGFKGFNQRSVSHIIREVNPETQALKSTAGPAA